VKKSLRESNDHKKVPAERKYGGLGTVATITAIGAIALATTANKASHDPSDSRPSTPISAIYHPKTAEELVEFAETNPKKVERLDLAPGMMAGSIAGDLAKHGYYYQLKDEVQEQQDGAVLPDHGQILVEKRFLENPNAGGLSPYNSGSQH
jgi:hypothetical protein